MGKAEGRGTRELDGSSRRTGSTEMETLELMVGWRDRGRGNR